MVLKSAITPRVVAIAAVSLTWIAFQLYIAFFVPLHPLIQSPLHLSFALFIVFLYEPLDKKYGVKWLKFIDGALLLGTAFIIYYFMSQAGRLTLRVPYISPVATIDVVAMVVCILVLLEAVRRILGNIFWGFIIIVIAYMWFGPHFPGIFRFGGTNLNRFTDLMVLGTSGILGTPLHTSVNSLFYFILFGAFFASCGGGKFLLDMGMKFSKGSSGGPAKAVVVSSALVGTISGSAIANVTTTGPVTIPMMKRVGYTPEQAAAIEAVASTGGQILPPIMGIGAFIMAEMLGIPYRIIAASATIPALAYFLSIFLLVSFMAKRRDAIEGTESLKEILKDIEVKSDPLLPRIYLLTPIFVLMYFVIQGSSLMRSGMMGIFAILFFNVLSKFVQGGKNYVPLVGMWNNMLQGIKQAAAIAIPTAACGIIIGSIIQSGLAVRISTLIAGIGITHLSVALLITMVGSLVLGLGLPTVAAYLVSVVIFVPTLTRLGIEPIVAHMFVFYFGVLAQITPPVCLASFTAAGIAGAHPMKTGLKGAQYAMVAFMIPFVFVYAPAILLRGSAFEIASATVVLIIGTFFLASGMAGYMFIPIGVIERGLLIIGAILLIAPEPISGVIGLCIGVSMLVMCWARKRKMLSVKTAA